MYNKLHHRIQYYNVLQYSHIVIPVLMTVPNYFNKNEVVFVCPYVHALV
jgi:hypothetical protein